jgi:hypothetical protein
MLTTRGLLAHWLGRALVSTCWVCRVQWTRSGGGCDARTMPGARRRGPLPRVQVGRGERSTCRRVPGGRSRAAQQGSALPGRSADIAVMRQTPDDRHGYRGDDSMCLSPTSRINRRPPRRADHVSRHPRLSPQGRKLGDRPPPPPTRARPCRLVRRDRTERAGVRLRPFPPPHRPSRRPRGRASRARRNRRRSAPSPTA